jgi:hypothetical protein
MSHHLIIVDKLQSVHCIPFFPVEYYVSLETAKFFSFLFYQMKYFTSQKTKYNTEPRQEGTKEPPKLARKQ